MTTGSASATSDDKLWALLAYVFPVLGSVLIYLQEGKKNRPFIKQHNAQALVYGIAAVWIGGSILSTVLFFCLGLPWLILYGISVYWGFQAYGGKSVEIPVISNFVKQQGWA